LDATLRIERLRLKVVQMRSASAVVVELCLSEQEYNQFYGHLACELISR
jgi:hypothetical protein